MHYASVFLHGISRIDIAFVLSIMAFNVFVMRFGMWPYSLVTLPGTVAHELMHWFIAKVFFARPSFPSLWPRRQGDQWTMGSVAFVPTMFNAIPVALAPLLLLPLGVFFMSTVMHPASGVDYVIYGWVTGNMLFASMPSEQDWKIAAPAILCVVLLCGIYFFFAHLT